VRRLATFRSLRLFFTTYTVFLASAISLRAHPGSGIAADAAGNIYFVDTGRGVWKLDTTAKLTRIHTLAYHWMALDEKGHFATSQALGQFDGGSFERVTPAGAIPAAIVSSDYPVTIGADGALYYVPNSESSKREIIRRTSNGQRSVVAVLPPYLEPKPMSWVNGITTAPDGSLYVTDNDWVRKVDAKGVVTTVKGPIKSNDCDNPLEDVPALPYLRGLAVARDGTIYAAANGCRAVIAISPTGAIRTVLKADAPWSPTGIVLSGSDLFVLEYLHTPGHDRKAWLPRVRKVARDGKVTTVASVEEK
jgi:hypothetical protein